VRIDLDMMSILPPDLGHDVQHTGPVIFYSDTLVASQVRPQVCLPNCTFWEIL